MKIVSVLAFGIAVLASLYAVHTSQPTSARVYLFWDIYLLLPYVAMGYLLWRSPTKTLLFGIIGTCLLTVYALLDTFFIHPDAQGMIFVAMIPLLQFLVLGALWGIPKIWHSGKSL